MFERNNDRRALWQSQNFLKDPKLVAGLVQRSSINLSDHVVEVGPGKGIITTELSKVARKVTAVEYDSRFAIDLKTRYADIPNVQIVEADFLRWELPREPFKVFSNPPFNLTSDILNKLTKADILPDDIYLFLQKEALRRFEPGVQTTQFATLIYPFFTVNRLVNVEKNAYEPKPAVDTVFARFEKRQDPLIVKRDRQDYRDFVVYGYNQWKATLKESLKGVFSGKQLKIVEKDHRIGNRKPSEVSPVVWIALFETFQKYGSSGAKHIIWNYEKVHQSKQKGMQKDYRTRNIR